jgi:hypothetical protein
MSDTRIKDGSGNCYTAKVDDKLRLHINGVATTSLDSANNQGRAFRLLTGDIELTTDGESAVIYLCNSEDSPLVLEEFEIGLGASTGGTGAPKLGAYTVVTSGTIIDAAVPAGVLNTRIGSPITLDTTVYRGFEGATNDGLGFPATLSLTLPDYENRLPRLILEKGQCAVLTITPPTGNTSMIVNVALSVYLNDFV